MHLKVTTLIGAGMGICAGMGGCETAPHALKKVLASKNMQFDNILDYSGERNDMPELKQYFTNLANLTSSAVQNGDLPIVIGGDHSIAIGTWSGVSSALNICDETLGLIWIDAHMDSHTPETSPSQNIHGMPVATLLGHGYQELNSILNSNPKIKPDNIILIGIRSYEDGEAKLLAKLGTKVYYNYDVDTHGFTKIFNESVSYLSGNVDKLGLSIDLDGFDPEDIPGVGTPVDGGVNFNAFLDELRQINLNNVVAIEIAECNPTLDNTNKTLNSVMQILDVINYRVVEYNSQLDGVV